MRCLASDETLEIREAQKNMASGETQSLLPFPHFFHHSHHTAAVFGRTYGKGYTALSNTGRCRRPTHPGTTLQIGACPLQPLRPSRHTYQRPVPPVHGHSLERWRKCLHAFCMTFSAAGDNNQRMHDFTFGPLPLLLSRCHLALWRV